jgi:phage-related baseplate assembly protein
VDLVFATREPEHANLASLKPLIQYGASPRATLALAAGARAETVTTATRTSMAGWTRATHRLAADVCRAGRGP